MLWVGAGRSHGKVSVGRDAQSGQQTGLCIQGQGLGFSPEDSGD